MHKQSEDMVILAPDKKMLLTIDEAAALLSLSRSMIYDLIWQNEISSIKIGRIRRIVASSLHEYIACTLGQAI